MLIPFPAQKRESASDPPTQYTVGIDPFGVCRVEPSDDDGISLMWCDEMDTPYQIVMQCLEIINLINSITCEPEPSDTESE